MRQILFSLAALLFVLAGAVPADAQTALHGSAPNTIIDRTLLRRAARLTALRREHPRSRSSSSARSASVSSSSTPATPISDALRRRELRRRERGGTQEENILLANLLSAIDMERALNRHAPLKLHTALSLAAQRHAEDMIARGYFAHENPEGLRVGKRVRAAGYGNLDTKTCQCSYRISIGENLAKGQRTVNYVIQSWLASPSHREALLSDLYTEIGIGIADDVWVLNFGNIEISR